MPRAFHRITEQRKASKQRWQDAQVLFANQRWRGAMYLGGYALECLLKAKLMKIFSCTNLSVLEIELQRRGVLTIQDSLFTHHLEWLMELTQGFSRLKQNKDLRSQFAWANSWMPAWRYSSQPTKEDEAETFMNAVASITKWVENNV